MNCNLLGSLMGNAGICGGWKASGKSPYIEIEERMMNIHTYTEQFKIEE